MILPRFPYRGKRPAGARADAHHPGPGHHQRAGRRVFQCGHFRHQPAPPSRRSHHAGLLGVHPKQRPHRLHPILFHLLARRFWIPRLGRGLWDQLADARHPLREVRLLFAQHALPIAISADAEMIHFTVPAAVGPVYDGLARHWRLVSSTDLEDWSTVLAEGIANGSPASNRRKSSRKSSPEEEHSRLATPPPRAQAPRHRCPASQSISSA